MKKSKSVFGAWLVVGLFAMIGIAVPFSVEQVVGEYSPCQSFSSRASFGNSNSGSVNIGLVTTDVNANQQNVRVMWIVQIAY
jgi:hypothetical protein